MRAAAINHQTPCLGGHAGTKAMTAGADKPARLKSAFHGSFSVRFRVEFRYQALGTGPAINQDADI